MQRPHLTPREHAIASAEEGRRIARVIDDAILALHPQDSDVLSVYAERVRHCSREANIWTARDLNNGTEPELYDGAGRFWHCRSKLCGHCLAKMSQKNRRNLRNSIKLQRVDPIADREAVGKWIARADRSDANFPELSPLGLPVGEKYTFITLTMPTKFLSLLVSHEIIDYAWQLFRKRRWFRLKIRGGGKAEEYTVHKIGFHYHIHILARTKYIDYTDLRGAWTECLKKSFVKFHADWKINCKDGMVNANAKPIGSIEQAIKEVAKYMTKSCSWEQMDMRQLLDACRIRRWPRMFELFGEFAPAKLLPVAVPEVDNLCQEKKERKNKDYLDTTPFTDAKTESGWRESLATLGVVRYLEKMDSDSIAQCQYRKEQLKHCYKFATFSRLRGRTTIDIEACVKRLIDIYARSGLPPPHSVVQHMSLQAKLDAGAMLNGKNYTWYQPA